MISKINVTVFMSTQKSTFTFMGLTRIILPGLSFTREYLNLNVLLKQNCVLLFDGFHVTLSNIHFYNYIHVYHIISIVFIKGLSYQSNYISLRIKFNPKFDSILAGRKRLTLIFTDLMHILI